MFKPVDNVPQPNKAFWARGIRWSLRRRTHRTDRNRGQGLVEFAFCLPLMLLLLLGTIDFGQIFFEYIQMRNAVREGAVYAARYSQDGEDAITKAVKESGGTGGVLDNADTKVKVDYSGSLTFNSGATVTVTATRVFKPNILTFFERIGLSEVTMTASSTAQVWT